MEDHHNHTAMPPAGKGAGHLRDRPEGHTQEAQDHDPLRDAPSGVRSATKRDHTAHRMTAGEHEGRGGPPPAGHQAHPAHLDHTGHEAMFRRRFWVCLVLSVPVLIYSPAIQGWFGFTPPPFPGSSWIAPLFSVVVFGYGGLPFLRMAVPELRNRKPGMMTLISLAIGVAFVYSLAALVTSFGETFFWELVTLIDIMLLGHWLEMRSVRQASGALHELARLMPDTAERVTGDGQTEHVPVRSLRTGDLVLVRPGASVPADGEVVEGESDVSEAMITGESNPVGKRAGAEVIAGTINGDGSLRVRVTATGDETALAGIMRLVEQAQQSKSNTQILADKAAGWLFYVALGVAAITGVAWTIAIGFDAEVVARVATVLVIACPHALGLAIPLVVAITTAIGAGNGILVRDRLALEEARRIDTVIFDKTGTLTKAEFGVVGMATSTGWSEDRALALAAAVEGDSEHTMARGDSPDGRRARSRHCLECPASKRSKGGASRALHDGRQVHVGGPRLLEALAVEPPEELRRFEQQASLKGQSVVYLIRRPIPGGGAGPGGCRPPGEPAGHRPPARHGRRSGDAHRRQPGRGRRRWLEELGIDQFFAEVLPGAQGPEGGRAAAPGQARGHGRGRRERRAGAHPGRRRHRHRQRHRRRRRIGGDHPGAEQPAGRGQDLRAQPGQLPQDDPEPGLGHRLQHRRASAGGRDPGAVGILLSPALGALFMSLSTVIVAVNAQLLRRVRLAA